MFGCCCKIRLSKITVCFKNRRPTYRQGSFEILVTLSLLFQSLPVFQPGNKCRVNLFIRIEIHLMRVNAGSFRNIFDPNGRN